MTIFDIIADLIATQENEASVMIGVNPEEYSKLYDLVAKLQALGRFVDPRDTQLLLYGAPADWPGDTFSIAAELSHLIIEELPWEPV